MHNKKTKFAAKNKTGTTYKWNKLILEDELPHELFLTTRQTTKTRNIFTNNIPTDIKLSKAQISELIQSNGSFGYWLAKKSCWNYLQSLIYGNLDCLVKPMTVTGAFLTKRSYS